jgi:hypothetical protein
MMSEPNDTEPQADKGPNPYDGRNHESGSPISENAKVGVASLLGHLAGSLSEIDKQNVGGSTSLKAKKIDPKQAYQQIMGTSPVQAPAPQPQMVTPQTPVQVPPHSVPVQQPVSVNPVDESVYKRLERLEKIVETYKLPLKFKRGINYTINTPKIKGTFSDPVQIIELLSTELSKQTKSITLKLNDNTKVKQQG